MGVRRVLTVDAGAIMWRIGVAAARGIALGRRIPD